MCKYAIAYYYTLISCCNASICDKKSINCHVNGNNPNKSEASAA